MRKTNVIQVKVTEEFKEKATRAAKKQHKNVSEYVRGLIFNDRYFREEL